MLRLLLTLPLLILTSCGSVLTEGTADLAGVAGAGAASAVTRSAAGAAAIGLAVRSVAAEGLRYAERRVHRAEQDAIATAAGPLAEGAIAPWFVVHDVAIEPDEHGDVTVARSFGAGALRCKEVVFSVDSKRHGVTEHAFYVATVCQDGARWRWASAEPATERWGALQ